MKHVLVILVVLFTSKGEGATYYFSDCATGGAGTLASPYCLDPGNDGTKDSIQFLFNGSAPEAQQGDTIQLCAGACDGSGTSTYPMGAIVRPNHAGTLANPITIQGYAGETVILSGQASNLANIINDDSQPSHAYLTWKNLIFEKTTGTAIYLAGNAAGWIFDGIEVGNIGTNMWTNRDWYGSGCTSSSGEYGMFIWGLAGPITVRNSKFHHICGMAHRNIVNSDPAASFLFENNEYYNTMQVSNDWDGHDVIYRNIYAHDNWGGIGIEDRVSNVTIEDSTFSCPGQYKVESDGRCNAAITVNDGDCGCGGATKNITIRRNRIFSSVDGSYGGSSVGYFLSGIDFSSTNRTVSSSVTSSCGGSACFPSGHTSEPINVLIENNMIWHIYSWTDPTGGIVMKTNRPEVTIQNNTIYDCVHGLSLDATQSGVGYTVRNNLLVKSNKNGSNTTELDVKTNAATSAITFNNISDGGQGGTVVAVGGTNYSCANAASVGTGNKCVSASFVNVAGPVDTWNLHLQPAPANAGIIDSGTAGSLLDMDKQSRTGSVDIGADEISSLDNTKPAAPTGLRIQ